MNKWTDQDPIGEGYLGMSMDMWAADALVYFDNMSVFELNTPFVSIFAGE